MKRKWYVIDAADQTLGRLSTEVANILRGKNKPIFTPHIDTGDYVIIVNADKVKVTGKKLDQKIYYRHSEYVGGMKETTLKEMMNKKPEFVVEHAVKGMLQRDLSEDRCFQSFMYMPEQSIHMQRSSRKYTRLLRDINERLKGGKYIGYS